MRIRYVLLFMFLVSGTYVFANGTCSSVAEFQEKNNYFQTKALQLMSGKSSVAEAESLLNEQRQYYNSLVPSCLSYFETSPQPDCSKIHVLTTAYIMLDKDKQPATKEQILNLIEPLSKVCPYEIKSIEYTIK